MWQTKHASLQCEMCELTSRLYEEKERSLCLELCLKEMERKVGGRCGAFAGPGPCNQVHLHRQPNLCCPYRCPCVGTGKSTQRQNGKVMAFYLPCLT